MDGLRSLPSINELLERPALKALAGRIGRAAALEAARAAVAEARERLKAGEAAGVSESDVERAAAKLLQPRLRRVINATGVVLHTNLGRAPLHPEAAARAAEVAAGYSSLEVELATGKRGHRADAIAPLATALFGCEAAFATTNCAGATLLALAALGGGGSAIVSRGELVEIGGGFRVPEIMAQSGCRLIEVGTTNRTHLRDYERALDENPRALLLRVHRSNFALAGFVTEPSVAELAQLAHARGTILVHDLGSGAVELPPGLPDEPTAKRSLQDGADLVLASGDKLLGGPQAGLLLGKRAVVEICKKHPLARALRPDKMLLAALETTLQLYRSGRAAELPVVQMLGATESALRQKATRLALMLGEKGVACRVVECEGKVGGGSMPTARLPSSGVAVDGPSAEALLAALRSAEPPVVALVREGAVTLDVRCVAEGELLALAGSVAWAAACPAQASDAAGRERATLDVEEAEE